MSNATKAFFNISHMLSIMTARYCLGVNSPLLAIKIICRIM